MKAAPFAYERPSTLKAATALMAETHSDAKIMAGGQSLGPMLNLRLVQPELIIDITGLAELKQADRDGDELVIGACVTHGDIEDGRVPDVTRKAMQRVAGGIAYRAVRNRGTIGGSLSHADPAADWVSALPALGAKVRLRGPSGHRDIAVEDFMTGALETALQADELLESVRVPAMRASARWAYVKACRKPGEFAHAIAAVLIDPESASGTRGDWARSKRRQSCCAMRRCCSAAGSPEISKHEFVASAADALLSKAGVANAADRHIHVAILRRAIAEAAA